MVEIRTEDPSPSNRAVPSADGSRDDESEEESSVLQALSSEQLARRPSFKSVSLFHTSACTCFTIELLSCLTCILCVCVCVCVLRRILDDLSSADVILKGSSDPLAAAAAATLQAQHVRRDHSFVHSQCTTTQAVAALICPPICALYHHCLHICLFDWYGPSGVLPAQSGLSPLS